MTVSFDLIRDPWVAAIRRDGTPVTLSLVDLFAQSAELLDITYSSPLERAAVWGLLRYVSAMAWPDGLTAGEAGRLIAHPDPTPILRVLDGRCWNLMDASHPAFQDATVSPCNPGKWGDGLEPGALTRYWRLPAERLTPADATVLLLTVRQFDTAGVKTGLVDDPDVRKGKRYGGRVPPPGRLWRIRAMGDSIWESLILSHPPVDGRRLRLTLIGPERRVLFRWENGFASSIIVSTGMITDTTDWLDAIPDALTRPDRKGEPRPVQPVETDTGDYRRRPVWRDWDAFTSNRLVRHAFETVRKPIRFDVSAVVYGSNNAVVNDAWDAMLWVHPNRLDAGTVDVLDRVSRRTYPITRRDRRDYGDAWMLADRIVSDWLGTGDDTDPYPMVNRVLTEGGIL